MKKPHRNKKKSNKKVCFLKFINNLRKYIPQLDNLVSLDSSFTPAHRLLFISFIFCSAGEKTTS